MHREGTNSADDLGLNPALVQARVERGCLCVQSLGYVLCQLGYDQGAVRNTDDMSYFSALVTENRFVYERRMQILAGAKSLFSLGLGKVYNFVWVHS